MKKHFQFFAFIIFSFSTFSLSAQWGGSNTTENSIFRRGNVGIGQNSATPNDTKLFVVSRNQKVGIVAQTDHEQDFQFGIISAVNRKATKAFAVLLDDGDGYKDKFAVMGNGTVFAEEIIVQIPIFPDYVFENDYELMSLSQLERYIKNNKHLPNIPPAKEIVESGLNVGDIQVKQMEKIEELFLYVIELEKKVKELEIAVEKNQLSKHK